MCPSDLQIEILRPSQKPSSLLCRSNSAQTTSRTIDARQKISHRALEPSHGDEIAAVFTLNDQFVPNSALSASHYRI